MEVIISTAPSSPTGSPLGVPPGLFNSAGAVAHTQAQAGSMQGGREVERVDPNASGARPMSQETKDTIFKAVLIVIGLAVVAGIITGGVMLIKKAPVPYSEIKTAWTTDPKFIALRMYNSATGMLVLGGIAAITLTGFAIYTVANATRRRHHHESA